MSTNRNHSSRLLTCLILSLVSEQILNVPVWTGVLAASTVESSGFQSKGEKRGNVIRVALKNSAEVAGDGFRFLSMGRERKSLENGKKSMGPSLPPTRSSTEIHTQRQKTHPISRKNPLAILGNEKDDEARTKTIEKQKGKESQAASASVLHVHQVPSDPEFQGQNQNQGTKKVTVTEKKHFPTASVVQNGNGKLNLDSKSQSDSNSNINTVITNDSEPEFRLRSRRIRRSFLKTVMSTSTPILPGAIHKTISHAQPKHGGKSKSRVLESDSNSEPESELEVVAEGYEDENEDENEEERKIKSQPRRRFADAAIWGDLINTNHGRSSGSDVNSGSGHYEKSYESEEDILRLLSLIASKEGVNFLPGNHFFPNHDLDLHPTQISTNANVKPKTKSIITNSNSNTHPHLTSSNPETIKGKGGLQVFQSSLASVEKSPGGEERLHYPHFSTLRQEEDEFDESDEEPAIELSYHGNWNGHTHVDGGNSYDSGNGNSHDDDNHGNVFELFRQKALNLAPGTNTNNEPKRKGSFQPNLTGQLPQPLQISTRPAVFEEEFPEDKEWMDKPINLYHHGMWRRRRSGSGVDLGIGFKTLNNGMRTSARHGNKAGVTYGYTRQAPLDTDSNSDLNSDPVQQSDLSRIDGTGTTVFEMNGLFYPLNSARVMSDKNVLHSHSDLGHSDILPEAKVRTPLSLAMIFKSHSGQPPQSHQTHPQKQPLQHQQQLELLSIMPNDAPNKLHPSDSEYFLGQLLRKSQPLTETEPKLPVYHRWVL